MDDLDLVKDAELKKLYRAEHEERVPEQEQPQTRQRAEVAEPDQQPGQGDRHERQVRL